MWCQGFGVSPVKEAGQAAWAGGRPQLRRGLEEGRGGYCIGYSAIPVLAEKLGTCLCGSIHDMRFAVLTNSRCAGIEHSLSVHPSPQSISRTFSSSQAYCPHFPFAPASEAAMSFCLRAELVSTYFSVAALFQLVCWVHPCHRTHQDVPCFQSEQLVFFICSSRG